jgi:hypothetical protein
MQAMSRDQTKEEIFVVVGNSGCRGPTPIFGCWPVHAQAPESEWNPFQEPPKISRSQQVFADIAVLLWPAGFVAEFLALAVTDAGHDSGAALPSTIIFLVSLFLNAAIHLGIGLILWFFGEVFSSFFKRRSPA